MSHHDRLHALDAVRAFALLLGVVFHAGFSFIPGMPPGLWAAVDVSPSHAIPVLLFASHMFRMSLFFFIAGFFARMLYQRKGARGFWADRSRRILVPLVAGWLLLFPSIAAVWIWGYTREGGTNAPVPPPDAAPPPGAFPLTHLWFLYYLLVLYIVVVLCRRAFVALDRSGAIRRVTDALVRRAVRSGAAAVALAVPVTAALYTRENWIAWFGIPTPDNNLIPQWTSVICYGMAVAFGWLVNRQADLLEVWAKQWRFHLAAALLATAACLSIAGVAPALTPAAAGVRTLAFALSYGIGMWCWNFALLGLATRFLSAGNGTIRYLADASYWIYLVHLPVVAALQVVVAKLPWHWSLKFPLIVAVSVAVLLASYRYLVRSTFIGQMLNGRRYPRTGGGGGSHAESGRNGTPLNAAGGSEASPSVAILAGVHKSYGKTVALAGVDLKVRRGELLAVLGPNGAGKSTAIALWLGLLDPDAGTVRLLDGSPTDVERRRHIGVMMQEAGLTPELRVRELIALTASYYPDPLPMHKTLELTRLDALADRAYVKLSAGQKRQVQFALAICGRPSVLFLDEPTVGLDVEAREAMWRTIRRFVGEGASVVLTTHYLEEAEALADRVAVLASGRLIASGSVAEVRSLVSRKHITCVSTLPLDEVRSWPEVLAARCDTQRLQITAVDAEAVVRKLLAADHRLRDLEIRQARLAEAVVELTKEAA